MRWVPGLYAVCARRQTVLVPEDVLTVARELAEITRLVEDDDFATTLARFVARAVRTVPGCGHALITVRAAGVVETVASDRDAAVDVTAPGPVIEAVTFAEPRRLDDVATDQRWVVHVLPVREFS